MLGENKMDLKRRIKNLICEAEFKIKFKNIKELKDAAKKLNMDKDTRGKISNIDLKKSILFFTDKKVYEKAIKILGKK